MDWSKIWEDISTLPNTTRSVTDATIINVLDKILSNKAAGTAFSVVMLANSGASMHRDIHGTYPVSRNKNTTELLSVIRKVDNKIATSPFGRTMNQVETLAMQALVQPNIAGIPISSPKVETNRDIEVSESMVIVQSEAVKQYWTDNSVPRLKEWTVEGYLTSMSPLDSGHIIKPTLQWQAYYLDVCAKSRRPVLFKTNRGEFVKVQITNLHTTEEASYNNGIHITATLKEYNPYFIEKIASGKEIANRIAR